MYRKLMIGLVAVPLLFGVVACGSDGDEDAATTTDGGAGADCTTEGTTDEPADAGAVAVELGEWFVTPSPADVPAGISVFIAENQSEEDLVHELVLVQADGIDSLEVDGDTVSEDALGDSVVGEIAEFPAGQTCSAKFDLAAGDYVLFCNLPTHFEQGMAAELSVTA